MTEPGASSSDSLDAPVIQHRLSAEGADELLLAGVNDVHVKALARLGDLRVILRNDQLILSGDIEAVERCTPVAQRMIQMAAQALLRSGGRGALFRRGRERTAHIDRGV